MDEGKNLDEQQLSSIVAPEQSPPPVAGYWSADIGSFGPTHDAHHSAQSNPSFAAPDNAHIRTFDLLSSSPHWTPPRIFDAAPILPMPVFELSSPVRPPQGPREFDDDDRIISSSVRPPQRPRAPAIDSRSRSLSPLTSISDDSSRSPTPEIAQRPHAEGCAICGQVRPLRRICRDVAGRWCEPCYRYRLHHGIERPERLWVPRIRLPTRSHHGPPAADHVCGDCGVKTKKFSRSCLKIPGLRCNKCSERLRTWIHWHRERGLPVTSLPVRARPSATADATAEDIANEDIADEDIADEDEVRNELLDIADEEEVRNALLDFTDET
ncbi:hypothetical protein C8F01DRAFT_1377801 [Mycena amicta]|nr:hypothetical protein C8F01DRAFT_1377801 [Mycena amicta]